VGGKSLLRARQDCAGVIDFEGPARDGFAAVDWPIIAWATWSSVCEKFAGICGNKDGLQFDERKLYRY